MKSYKTQLEAIRDHKPGINLYLACTGAGAGLQKILWDIPGASSFLVGCSFPYATRDTDEFLGFETDTGYCNQEMAMNMAIESYYRAIKTGNIKDGKLNVGLGLSASVFSLKEHRGSHRVHVAVVTDNDAYIYNIELKKANTSRQQDGDISDKVGLCAIIHACLDKSGMYSSLMKELISETNNFEIFDSKECKEFLSYCFWKRPYFSKSGKRFPKLVDNEKTGYFAGSFNPPHEGHFGIANEFINLTGGNVIFTISGDHPSKGNLDIQEMLWRAKLLSGHDRVFTLGEPLFLNKTQNHPNRAFLMGSDTLLTLLDPKWGPSTSDVIAGLKEANTRLYISVRSGSEHLDNIVGLNYIKMDGTWDISSTELRKNNG